MITPGGWGLFAGWLLKSSAQAALLVVLVLAVQWLLRRRLTPRWRYFLWWLVVARLLMPVSLPGPVSIFNWVKWNSPPAPAMAVTQVTPDVGLPALPPDTIATAIEETTPALPAQSPVTIAAPAPTAPTRPPFDWRLGAMWLWLAGAALLGARLVWSVLRMRRELRRATPVDDPTVLALLDDCREQMRVRDRLALLETPLVNSPALCGFWRPKLLLPPGLCRDFTAQQLRFIFLHELAHVRRHDIAVNWLITLLQLLHWFNPLVWLAFSRLRADRELACDALALSVAAPGEQHAYGETIIRLLEGFARPSAMPGLVGILEDKNQMKRRIRMIAQFRRPGRWAWLSGIAAAILGIACLTDAQPEPADPPANVVDAQPSPSTQVGKIRMSGIQQLEKEWEHLTAEYNRKLAEIEALEKELSQSSATNEIWSYRQLYRQREEAGLELTQMSALASFLTSRTHAALKMAATALPDPTLAALLEQLAVQEQKQAQLDLLPTENGPALARIRAVISELSTQIDQRVDVALVELSKKTEAKAADRARIDEDLKTLEEKSRGLAPDRRAYFTARRDLESIQFVRERLRTYIFQEKVDAGLPTPNQLRTPQSSNEASAKATRDKAIQIHKHSPEQLDVQVQICEVAFQDDDLPELGRILGGSLERFSSAKSESRLTNAVEAAPPQVMTEARHNEVMRLLKQRSDVDFITALRVVTMSGRQARINIVTNTDAITGQTNLTTAVSVEATVFPDGTTIEVQAAAMIKTFIGYSLDATRNQYYDYVSPPNVDSAKVHETLPSAIPERPSGSNVPRAPIRNQEPIPVFRLRQTVANATVWDGQTMVLSRMTIGSPMGSRTGVPAINNLSLVGRLFSSESFGPRNSLVLIFITPTIIDPAGNRVHSEKDLPFARTNVPPQRGIK